MSTVAHTCSDLLIAIDNINTVCEIGLLACMCVEYVSALTTHHTHSVLIIIIINLYRTCNSVFRGAISNLFNQLTSEITVEVSTFTWTLLKS